MKKVNHTKNIYKTRSESPIDFAAEELRKYLRMMMPDAGNYKIECSPDAKDGFRLGLMQDFGLDISDAEDVELDDILYIDCDERGGIIAGSNPRSVLLSVYEYFKWDAAGSSRVLTVSIFLLKISSRLNTATSRQCVTEVSVTRVLNIRNRCLPR